MNILFVASFAPSLITFRKDLIINLINKGNKVYTICPMDNHPEIKRNLKELGVNVFSIKMDRGALNPFKNIGLINEIYKMIKFIRPKSIFSYTIKPVIFTGLALFFYRIIYNKSKIKYIVLITGLGYVFTKGSNFFKRFFLRLIVKLIYKIGLTSANQIIFQNKDDMSFFKERNLLPRNTKLNLVNGSGVNLSEFRKSKPPKKPIFLMLSRLLKDKGLIEYIEAARIVKTKRKDVIFRLAGFYDQNNPSTISNDEFIKLKSDPCIEYLGEIKDVKSEISKCKFYVLPSYREGTPRSVLEALATGRAIITTNAPGCNQTVINRINGIKVNPKNSIELANAMFELIGKTYEEITLMSNESRKLAETKYDVRKVNKEIIKIINS